MLAAARDTFEEKGYQASTVGAITARAETAHGTFYLYFKNKEDVFCRVIAESCDELYREAQASWAGDAREALYGGNLGFMRTFGDHRRLWRALLEGMLQSPAIEQVWLDLRKRFLDRLTVVLQSQLDAGVIRELDPRLTAHALGAMTEWFAFSNLVLAEPDGTDSPEQLASTVSELWFFAIYGTIQ